MSDSFGDQIVIFVTLNDGPKDRYGIPSVVRTEVSVTNCRFRPFSAEETVTLTDLATEMWKCTAPPDPAVLAAKAIDEMKHNGITYQIVGGIKPYCDATDLVYKVTVFGKKQNV
jgi:hypothetical protein